VRLFLCCLFFIFNFWVSLSQKINTQNPVYKNAIEFTHDNDFLLFTDRYYTTGTFIGWRKLLEQENDSVEKKQYSIFLVQQLYTPADILEPDLKRFDMPFAGFLGISNSLSLSNTRRLLDFKLLLGITGPLSGGSGIQKLFHQTAAENSRIPTWLGQIKTGAYGNLYTKYTREWQWQPNPFSVHFSLSPTLAFGNKDIYLQQDAAFFFGRRNSLQTTSAYQQLGSTQNEYFFAVRLGYRYVIHNALLEGNLLGDSSPFLIDPYKNMFLYNFETYARLQRYNLKLSYNFATPQTRRTQPHLYMTFSVIRVF